MKFRITAVAAAAALSFALGLGTPAAAAQASAGVKVSTAAATLRFDGRRHQAKFCRMGMSALSEITGLSEKELMKKYPQQTSWQIAYKLHKLDALKKAALSRHKKFVAVLVEQNRISAADAAKMTADFEKRLKAIDGKKIVILGRPGFLPEIRGGRPPEGGQAPGSPAPGGSAPGGSAPSGSSSGSSAPVTSSSGQ